jgi:hypothetical protein
MNTAVECLSMGTFRHHNDFEDPALIPSSCFGFSPLVCSCTGPISILYVTTTKLIYNSKACFGPKNIQLRSITSKPASALLLSCYEAWFRPWAVTSHVPFLFILEQRKRSPTLFWSPRNYLGGFHEIIALQNYLIDFFTSEPYWQNSMRSIFHFRSLCQCKFWSSEWPSKLFVVILVQFLLPFGILWPNCFVPRPCSVTQQNPVISKQQLLRSFAVVLFGRVLSGQ